MAYVQVEKQDRVMVMTLNRPERLNAMGRDLLLELAEAYNEYLASPDLWVAILTGKGRAFCAGEDLIEAAERGTPGFPPDLMVNTREQLPFMRGGVEKPVIGAVNGWAMGGGFILAWSCDFRVAVPAAVFEISEARHWLLGAYSFGFTEALPYAVAKELAMGFPLSAQRAYEVGFVNKIVDHQSELLPACYRMADHMLSLPPASLMNTLYISRVLRPAVPANVERLADRLRSHGHVGDIMESRHAFSEKRTPNFKGWDDPADRFRFPPLEPEA